MKKLTPFIILLLVGCQSLKQPVTSSDSIYGRYKNQDNRYTQLQDGAPAGYETISFKEPTPKKEPLSRYGNPSEYGVHGKKYRVLQNVSNFKERGVASWYGTKFHKHRTSSGEPYNMYQMSAAHRTLPLPTYVRVKNLNNGREVVVKVNDRGPFHSSRIIDLSYAAALKLGVFPRGTAPVEIVALAGPQAAGRYYLQAGAFATEALALQLKQKLKRITSSPIVIEHYRQRYVVKVGPLKDKPFTDNLKVKLEKNGLKGAFAVLA